MVTPGVLTQKHLRLGGSEGSRAATSWRGGPGQAVQSVRAPWKGPGVKHHLTRPLRGRTGWGSVHVRVIWAQPITV